MTFSFLGNSPFQFPSRYFPKASVLFLLLEDHRFLGFFVDSGISAYDFIV
jgi:hypothetical protein